ncbi:MAG: hypothetical protein MRY21_05150 [Simkaniaceae bacterium]|nr:hypothetical protein [Simkaniaceae bacterium]
MGNTTTEKQTKHDKENPVNFHPNKASVSSLLTKPQFSRKNPFLSKIKARRILNKDGSIKKTWHIVLDCPQMGLHPGDSIAVIPQNPKELVDAYLSRLGPVTIVHPKTQEEMSLEHFLTHHACLNSLSPRLAKHLAIDKARDPLTVITELDPQTFANLAQPLLPRYYSLASSFKRYPNELHLLVATFSYNIEGHTYPGIATNFLATTTEPVPIYPHPNPKFHVPQNDIPLIMIGPGTGLAPFRGFMQERGPHSENWLFFGECHRATDFYYENEWEALHDRLTVTTAFSRDQREKIYVQDRLREHAEELRSWLNRGAHIYVCGDAKHMAKDVEAAITEIYGPVRDLRKAGRYHADVY